MHVHTDRGSVVAVSGLPYRWHPMGVRHSYSEPIKVGDLIPHAHRVWVVDAINPLPEVDWSDEDRAAVADVDHYTEEYRPKALAKALPRVMVLRPVESPDERSGEEHYLLGGRTAHRFAVWDVYPDEHYPICSKCREPLPCREQMAVKVSEQSAERMGWYEIPGVCPACHEIVTDRQKSVTWPDNVEIPGGPPVTFHTRRKCHYSAVTYEKRWVAADPGRRRARFSCTGHVTNHNDGTYECTELHECPGPHAAHPSYTVCDCPDCHANGSFGCHPDRTSRNLYEGTK